MAILAATTPSQAGWQSLVVSFGLMFVVFYMLLWRPQQQQQKRRREMLASLKKGDRVVTAGGIHGEITGMKEDTLTVRIADKVEVKVSKSGVSQVKG